MIYSCKTALKPKPQQNLEATQVSLPGDALSWPSLDVDVYIPGLVERAFGTRLFAAAVTVYGIEEWLSRDLQSGDMPGGYVQPQGTGTISICKQCNEYSGNGTFPNSRNSFTPVSEFFEN